MKTKLLVYTLILASVFFQTGCFHQTPTPTDSEPKRDLYNWGDEIFAIEGDDGDKNYTERACIVNEKAGTLCFELKGKCKKVKGCEEVPPILIATPTPLEIDAFAFDHATWMLDNDYIDSIDFQHSEALYHDILMDFYYP